MGEPSRSAPDSDGKPQRHLTLPRHRDEVEGLLERLRSVERSLQDIDDDEIDAVLDPRTAAPILLSHAQQALARSEARFRDLVNRDPSVVWELAPDGRILFVNEAARNALGFEPDRLVGESFWSMVVEPGSPARPDRATPWQQAFAAGDITGFELPLRTATGDPRWFAWNSANRRDRDNELAEIVLFGTDITARRDAEERARELAEERLARATAEAANFAKMQFLTVMSHELRTPLNAISGYVQLLEMELKGPITAGQREHLGKISRAQRHLLGLINEVMNFAKLESGSLKLQMADVSLSPVLQVLRSLTEPQTAAKRLVYTISPCGGGCTVWADRDKLQQILINLVSNAIKFTSPGGRIDVTCERHPEGIDIVVTDTGQGIPANKLDSIFEPFVQVTADYTRTAEGIGLGLAISRDLARAMHGDLRVESVEGKGSAFTLTVPTVAQRPDPSRESSPA